MASPYDILIDIRARTEEVVQAAAAIQGIVNQATASGTAVTSGMTQGQAATVALTQAVQTLTGVMSTVASQGAASIKKAGDALEEASGHAFSFREAIEQAFAFGIGNQIVERLLEVPTRLIEGFQEALHAGVEYNAEMEKLGIGIAASLRQADPEHILNFKQAQEVGSQALDLLRTKANQLGLDLHSLAETFQINLRAMTEGGVHDMEQQINLVLMLSQAAASKGLSGFQAQRDIIDLLAGKGDRTIFAKELGITDQDIKTASQAGQLYQFLTDKLSAYGEAGVAAADTFGAASQRLHNQVEQLEGAVAKPLFDVLKKSANDLAAQLSSADFQGRFSVIAEQIGGAARVAVTFGAALVPMIPTIIEVTTAVGALAVALGTGGLITAMGSAVAEAGSLAGALAPVATRITAMLTALGPAGAIIGAAVAIMLVLEHEIASFEARARELLAMVGQYGTVIDSIDKQIGEADTDEKKAAAYAKLNDELTRLVQTRESLKRQGSDIDPRQLEAVNNQILQVQARLATFQQQAGKGVKLDQSSADASKYPTAVKDVTDADEAQREANMTKEQTHAEAMQQFDERRLAAAKALGLANDASMQDIRQAAYEVMNRQNALAANKPKLIDTAELSKEVNDVTRQFAEVQTRVQNAQKAAKEASGGGFTVSPQDASGSYNVDVASAEELTGKLKLAQDALAAAQAHNAEAAREGTTATRESNAEAARQLEAVKALQQAYARTQETQKAAQQEARRDQQSQVEDALAKAKLAAGPNNITPEVQELMVKSRELKLQGEYLQQNGKLDEEHLRLAHDTAVSEVAVTVAKKDGAKATRDATAATREQHQEQMATDRDRKTALQDIRNQLEELKSNPFLTESQKEQGAKPLLEQELALLEKNIAERKVLIGLYQTQPGKAGDAAKLQGENVADQHTANQDKQQLAMLGGGNQIKAQLVQLQNQWALTSTNIGKSITQNIQTAVDSVSTAIDGLIMGTHNWRQAFAQAGQAIIKNLIQLGVQMVANAVLGRVLGKSSATEQATNSATITAAAAPAAATTSISSYGVAAIVGAALAVAAIAAIIAMATSHATGGLIPGSPSYKDNRFAHVASGEYVVRTAAVQHYGPGFFHALNSMSMPRMGFATGGLVGERDGYTPILATVSGGSPSVNVEGHSLTVINAHTQNQIYQAMQSTAGKKIILGHVKGNRTEVGIKG